jgi:hypothetical protein
MEEKSYEPQMTQMKRMKKKGMEEVREILLSLSLSCLSSFPSASSAVHTLRLTFTIGRHPS